MIKYTKSWINVQRAGVRQECLTIMVDFSREVRQECLTIMVDFSRGVRQECLTYLLKNFVTFNWKLRLN